MSAINDEQKLINLNIAYLEDMPDIRKKMVADLRAIGCKGEIFELDTLGMGLEFLKQRKSISLFISDWNLPDGEGIDFLKTIRASAHYKNIPFLMCTTMDEVSHLLQAIETGANDYIVKPWDLKELKNKILTTLK